MVHNTAAGQVAWANRTAPPSAPPSEIAAAPARGHDGAPLPIEHIRLGDAPSLATALCWSRFAPRATLDRLARAPSLPQAPDHRREPPNHTGRHDTAPLPGLITPNPY